MPIETTPPPYPVKRPNAGIAAAVIDSTVLQEAMRQLQRKEVIGGVTRYYFLRSDLQTGATTGPGKLAIDNMRRYFDQPANQNVTRVDRDTMMRFVQGEAKAELIKIAGKDGKISPNEAKKLAPYLADDYAYITTGKVPR
jgi:hypothetical protein